MARRRRKNDSLIDLLIVLPWQVSAALACISFTLLRWIVPSVFSRNPFLVGLGAISQFFAWFFLIGFGFISVIAFARAKAQPTTPTLKTITPSHKSIEPSIALPAAKVGMEWGNSMRLEAQWGNSANRTTDPAAPWNVAVGWSLKALCALEWKRFELLCAKYYEIVGFKSKTLHCGADGGIDVKLFKNDPNHPLAIVQCKAWNANPVGVKEIRELLGVMAHEKVNRGIFITTATYTRDALEFGAANPIQLLDGMGFVKKIEALPKEQQAALFQFAFSGDYQTPTCPSCGIKMKKRESKRGPFWGCMNYPKCKNKFQIKA